MASLVELAQTDPQRARKRLNQIRNDEYLRGYIEGAVSVLSPTDVVIEFGANVGAMTSLLARTGAKVMAYEADPAAAEQLASNLTIRDNVETYAIAVAASDGTSMLYRQESYNPDNLAATLESTLLDKSATGFQPVNEIAVKSGIAIIEQALETYGNIAILYIDINGSELEILETLAEKGLFEKIRLTIMHTYQKDQPSLRERYRDIRLRIEGRPEWNVKLNKA